MKTSIVRKQRGALGLMMAMIMLVLVLFAALAIDMARLTYQQQALQSVADIAALEVSKENPYYIDPANSSGIESELRGKYFAEGKIDSGELGLKVVSGSAAIKDNYWTFSESPYSDENPYSAAQVEVTKTVPKSMIAGGLFNGETVTLTATAAIQKSGVVRLGIGSELISADLSIVDLSAVGYSGLVKSNIRLNDVISILPNVDLTTMTPEQVLNTEISASALLGAYADVLRLNHDEEGDNISIFELQLDAIADLVDELSSIPNLTLGQLLELSSTQPFAALGANVNALDLVKATLYAANKVNGVSLPAANINIPGVVSATSTLELIKAPQFKVALLPIKKNDEPSVSTEQIDLTANISLLSGTLSSLENLLDAIPLISNPVKVEISPIVIHAKGAQATATLFNGDVDSDFNLRVNQSLGTVAIDDFNVKVTVEVGVDLGILGGLSLVKVPIDITLTQNDTSGEEPDLDLSAQETNILVSLSDLPLEQTINAEGISINTHLRVASSEPDFSGDLVSVLVQGLVLPLVTPIVNTLISDLPSLLSPIINGVIVQSLSNLGVDIGTTTVWVDAAGTTQYGIIK